MNLSTIHDMVQDANKSEKGRVSFNREKYQWECRSDHRYIGGFGCHRHNGDGSIGINKIKISWGS